MPKRITSPREPFKISHRVSWISLALGVGVFAQDLIPVATSPVIANGVDNNGVEAPSEVVGPIKRSPEDGDVYTRPDARTMTLSIPALRGQIVDRYGNPLAQNKVVWYPALQFQQFENADRNFVVAWARQRINKANEVFGINWEVGDEELWQHYRHRRWLAMPYTHVVTSKRKKLLEPKLVDGLILHPIYQRYYPQKKLASHIIGYVGSKGKLEKGPINYGDPVFEYTIGRTGFEELFDKQLRGKPGLLQLQYDSNGVEVLREQRRAPKQGGTLVTTLDLEWQKRAEKILGNHTTRGALVILDVQTGEVVAMASRPSFDLNSFVPFISTSEFNKLLNDPENPLFGRAFQAEYPPASTFKPIVALAGLHQGVINENSYIDCPAYVQLGKHKMYNWSRKAEGSMDVVKGLYRSNNPFFIKLGIKARPGNIISMARRLGYGAKTNLPLVGEAEGLLPSNEYMLKRFKRRMTDGDTANMSIGQGVVLATPLQVAQGMAGIANGGVLPKLQLIRQVQDARGRVLAANQEEDRTQLGVSPSHMALVQEGLMKVVNIPAGTGKNAALTYTIVCGKTGTAQWGDKNKKQYLGWFAGFFPLDKPKYAFAMVYEGKPGEKVSGGGNAAPMVKSFFEPIKEEVEFRLNPPARAMVVEEDELIVGEDPIAGNGATGAANGDNTPIEPLDLPPPKAIPVEEDEEGVPPLRELPSGIDEPEPVPPSGDGVVQGPPIKRLEPAVIEEPVEEPEDPAAPPKAIPIEE